MKGFAFRHGDEQAVRNARYIRTVADLGGYFHHFYGFVLIWIARFAFAPENVEQVRALVGNSNVARLGPVL